jgi:hypothetical protein
MGFVRLDSPARIVMGDWTRVNSTSINKYPIAQKTNFAITLILHPLNTRLIPTIQLD